MPIVPFAFFSPFAQATSACLPRPPVSELRQLIMVCAVRPNMGKVFGERADVGYIGSKAIAAARRKQTLVSRGCIRFLLSD